MKTAKYIGDIGEAAAENHLKKRGWHILSRNFKGQSGEIDIIGYRFGVLAYFEVKTRSNDAFGSPASAVDGEKLSRISRTARAFLETYRVSGKIPVFYPLGIKRLSNIRRERIDVIEVFLSRDSKVEGINHIKDYEIILGEKL